MEEIIDCFGVTAPLIKNFSTTSDDVLQLLPT
jgi:hypothetical protein